MFKELEKDKNLIIEDNRENTINIKRENCDKINNDFKKMRIVSYTECKLLENKGLKIFEINSKL